MQVVHAVGTTVLTCALAARACTGEEASVTEERTQSGEGASDDAQCGFGLGAGGEVGEAVEVIIWCYVGDEVLEADAGGY
jgi:hypothetical protein